MNQDRFAIGAVVRAVVDGFIDMDLNEVVITGNLSDADRQRMEGYLAHKWGVE